MPESTRSRLTLFLLVSLVSLALMHGFFSQYLWGRVMTSFALLAVLFGATFEARSSLALTALNAVLAALTFVTDLAGHWLHLPVLFEAKWFCFSIFLALATNRLERYVLRPGLVTGAKLFDSVNVYLLLGLFWFSLYSWLEQHSPGSFRLTSDLAPHALTSDALLYFSYSTLTTTGFGDVIAVRPASRVLGALEAIAGVLYVAILVARLVALYGPRGAAGGSAPRDESHPMA